MGECITPYRPKIKRVVLTHNHREKTAVIAKKSAVILAGAGFSVEVISTVEGGREANAKQLKEVLKPGDAMSVVGGEGTYRDLAGALLLPTFDDLRQEVYVTSMNEGGTACDIGTALHGRDKHPLALFGPGMRAVAAYSLLCSITQPDGDIIQHHAMSYIGNGKSAEATAKVNSDKYIKGKPGLRDVGIVAGVLASKYSFDIVDREGMEAAPPEASWSDLTVAKGPRMAKHARFPIHHWENAMWCTPVPAGHGPTLRTAVALPFGRADGFSHTAPLAFTAATSILTHFDGEPPVVIQPGSQVEIGLAPEPYNVLTTQLAT
jgi:hypothetical protein